jgi:Ca2+/Na+ antiporter
MVIGSAISNILGAFSLGLIFHKGDNEELFDRSSRVWTLILPVPTAFAAVVLLLVPTNLLRWAGCIAIVLFVIYVPTVSWVIWKGRLSAPEDSDSDSDSSNSDNDTVRDPDAAPLLHANSDNDTFLSESRTTEQATYGTIRLGHNSDSPASSIFSTPAPKTSSLRRSLTYHIASLLLGMLAIILSSFILSHAASSLVTSLEINSIAFGAVVLAIATTVPEKFIAVVSGSRGHTGIMVANTVGSNIFLLTLCLGVLWVRGGDDGGEGGSGFGGRVKGSEVATMVGSTVAMIGTMYTNGRTARIVGGFMLLAYIAFLVLEFTVIHPK